jgi:hypothetical protein
MRTHSGGSFPRRRKLLRYNNVKRLMPLSTNRGNASAPTEPVAALHVGNSDRGPKRETIRGGGYLCQARVVSGGNL